MADYFDNGGAAATETGATTNGIAQPAANGDVMEDEILVSHTVELFNLLYHTDNM